MKYEKFKSIVSGHNDEKVLWQYINSELSTTAGHLIELEYGKYYLYITLDGFICVYIENISFKDEENDELVDEEPFNGENPLYFTATSHRTSPVFRTWQIVCELKRQLHTDKVYGVVLTNSHLINKEDFTQIWAGLDIVVRSELKDIPSSLPFKKLNAKNTVDIEIDSLPSIKEYADEIQNILTKKSIGEQLTETQNQEIESNDIDNEEKKEFTWKDLVDENDPDFFESVLDKKIPKPVPGVKILQTLDNPEEELNKMVGLDDIKSRLKHLSYLISYNKRAKEFGLKVNNTNQHSIFIGGPGTGKTTMAQIIGSYFKKIGLLSKGHSIVTNRSSFSGKLWGSEEENVRKILKLSQGGVLLIDEAYLLYNADEPRDPCNKILPLMLDLLADEKNRDIIVVLCGYEKEMSFLLNSNPGIKGRFRNYFYFKAFTFDELSEILHRRATEAGYNFSDCAWIKILRIINRNLKHCEYHANARDIINLWEEILENHAYRCVSNNITDLEGISQITDEDITL